MPDWGRERNWQWPLLSLMRNWLGRFSALPIGGAGGTVGHWPRGLSSGRIGGGWWPEYISDKSRESALANSQTNRNPAGFGAVGFPEEWRFVLILDEDGKGLHSDEERAAFAALPPMSATTSGELCRHVLMQLLPGVIEHDFSAVLTLWGGAAH